MKLSPFTARFFFVSRYKSSVDSLQITYSSYFHKVWISKYWTIDPNRVRFLWNSDHIFIDISIYNLGLCVFLFQGTLLAVYCGSINTELMVNRTVTHAWMKLTQHTHFLHKAHRSFLILRNTNQHFSAMLWDHFKQQSHQQKAQKGKIHCAKKTLKRTPVYGTSTEIRRQAVIFVDLSWGLAQAATPMCCPLHLAENDYKCSTCLISGLQVNFSK